MSDYNPTSIRKYQIREGVFYYQETGLMSSAICMRKFKVTSEYAKQLSEEIKMTKYEIIDVEQRSPEWLELRNNHIGASDAPVIMQESPWKTPFQLWQEKLAIKEIQAPNQNMERGIRLEEEARESFIKQTGIVVNPLVVKSLIHPWMLSSYDGVDSEIKNIVEIKCPGTKDHECAMDGVIPKKYLAQLFHQMITLGVDKAFYFSYNPTSSKILEITLDVSYSINLIEKEKVFWNCMNQLEAPDLIDKDYTLRTDLNFTRTAAEWVDVHSQLAYLEKREKLLRQSLVDMSGDSNVMGAGIKISKIMRKGTIPYKDIPEIKEMDVEKYRKDPIETWRISTY